jgi:hypothetical protein
MADCFSPTAGVGPKENQTGTEGTRKRATTATATATGKYVSHTTSSSTILTQPHVKNRFNFV